MKKSKLFAVLGILVVLVGLLYAGPSILQIYMGGTGQSSFSAGVLRSSGTALSSSELSGDVTTSGSNAVTLASVVTANSCGDTTHSCGLTYDAKGRITAATNNAISGGGGGGSGAPPLCDTSPGSDTLTANGTFATTCTLLANSLNVGSIIEFWAVGVQNVSSGDGAKYGALLDSSTVLSQQGTTSFVVTNSLWAVHGEILILLTGASGSFVGAPSAYYSYIYEQDCNSGCPNGFINFSSGTTATTLDTTGARVLKIQLSSFGGATSNSTLKRLVVWQKN